MPVYRLGPEFVFPPPELADESGLLAVGGDLEPERLLLAYASGIFPWYDDTQPILWHAPDPRMVLLASDLHIGRSLKRTLDRGSFGITMDTAFQEVVRACAETFRPGQGGTWITEDMVEAYVRLHALGVAHSCEAWRDDELVGGLYGVCLGGAFFGESMFATVNDASKVAFVHLVNQLHRWGIELVDCQVHTDHLERFGAQPWPRERFQEALGRALEQPTRHGPWRLEEQEP